MPIAIPQLPPIRQPLPYGTDDLDPRVVRAAGDPRQVRCFIRGCQRFLRVPKKLDPGEFCPDHGIRCHASQYGPTFTYADDGRNIIVADQQFRQRIIGHPFKFESDRMGLERSEDALSWNVWRSLYEARMLAPLVEKLTGETSPSEPQLYLWGLEMTNDCFEPWNLLIQARERFETHLPVQRPKTEPDIAIHLPGRYLILIEAKFTSPNTTYVRGRRKDKQSLTLDELIGIYQDPRLSILDFQRGEAADRVHYQLWRNMVFAEWMGTTDHAGTKAFHFNLVRDGFEVESEAEFRTLVKPAYKNRFKRFTWEQIHMLCQGRPGLARMCRYLETKTAGLQRAFRL